MPTIKLLKRAEIEVKEACEWYEDKQKGLSKYFRSELRSTLSLIALNPHVYSKRYGTELFFAPLNKFPFIIVYWLDDDLVTVFVVSVFNTKRNNSKFLKP